jgi:actin-related protein
MSSPCIVLDCGSHSVKAGLSTDDVPQVIRSVLGRSRKHSSPPFVGDSALANGDSVGIAYPIEEGMVTDFPDYELLVDFIYSALKTDSSQHPVVLAEAPFNSGPCREKTAELFFEKFSVPEMNIMLSGILTLVGTGRVTGLVIDCGHGGTNIVPIFESYVIPHAIETMRMGGKDLDTLLAKLLTMNDFRMAKSSDKETLRRIKEEHCFCRPTADWQEGIDEYPADVHSATTYKLPDGKSILLKNERFIVPEAYFAPSLVRCEGEGLAAMVANCIKNSAIDLTKPLVSNMILSGGSSQFAGFAQRLSNEVKFRVSAKMSREVKIVAHDGERKNCLVWNGGKAFADLRSSFQERWMTKEEYQEFGADYIHTKVMGSHSPM